MIENPGNEMLGQRVIYQTGGGEPEGGVIVKFDENRIAAFVRYDGDRTAKYTFLKDLTLEDPTPEPLPEPEYPPATEAIGGEGDNELG